MIPKTKLAGVVLAGGKSSRMGMDKALIQINESTMLSAGLALLRHFCKQTYVSSNSDLHDFSGTILIKDQYDSRGPVSGIISILEASSEEYVLVIAVDSPNISDELIDYLLAHAHPDLISVPIHQEFMEPLCAIYPIAQLEKIKSLYNNGINKLVRIIKEINYHAIPITPDLPFYKKDLFINLNRPDDLKNYLAQKED